MIGTRRPDTQGSTQTSGTGLPSSSSSEGPSSLVALVRRYPVGMFLVAVLAVACPVMSLPILADHGTIPDGWLPRLPGLDTERIASVLLVFVALLPAAMWTTWAVDGPTGVRVLMSRMFRWQLGVGWWLLVLAGLPTLTLGLAMLLGDSLQPVEIAPFVIAQLFGLLVNLVLINMWEETAWSGVVQIRLERRHGLVTAALLTAVPFALVHMPLHFIGNFSLGSLTIALVSLLIICALVRLMIGVFLRGTRDSILAVALLHTLFNRSNNDEGIVAGLLEGDGRQLAGLLAVIVMTVVVALVSRRRLTWAHRLALDSTAASVAERPTTPSTTKDPS